mgnify:CR=1
MDKWKFSSNGQMDFPLAKMTFLVDPLDGKWIQLLSNGPIFIDVQIARDFESNNLRELPNFENKQDSIWASSVRPF